MPLGLDSLRRKWVPVLRQCVIKSARRLLACSVYSSSISFKERVFLEMSFDLEISVKAARFNPYGMRCGRSWPDVRFPAVDYSGAEVLTCESLSVY